jgi:hypothetical protein
MGRTFGLVREGRYGLWRGISSGGRKGGGLSTRGQISEWFEIKGLAVDVYDWLGVFRPLPFFGWARSGATIAS